MKSSTVVIWLSVLIIVLALIAVCAAFFWPAAGSSFTFTSVRGERVQIY